MIDETINIRQFQYENEAAQRLLVFLQQENVFLKHRLAESLRECSFSGDQIIAAEQFQESLLQKDTVIGIMRQETAELEKMLVKYIHEDGTTRQIVQKLKKMRRDLRSLSIAFSDLRMKFNGFLESIS